MMVKNLLWLGVLILLGLTSMVTSKETPFELPIPYGIPQPKIPEANLPTLSRVELGKRLFFDKTLSSDSSVSCASCHAADKAFSDGKAVSTGVHKKTGTRNSMALINLAWSNSFFWDGGVPTLEMQVLKPLTSKEEMNMPVEEALNRIRKNPDYKTLFRKAYGKDPDAESLFKAIACFERTLLSFNSKFDMYFYQKRDVFNESELRGYKLFFDNNGKVHCASCHSGVNFTNNSFQNNGLYLEYPDEGRYKITSKNSDKGKFKVPTLRNIALTAPYMHDGSLKTLEEVIEHYNTGGKLHPNKSPHVHIHPSLELTETDKQDLVNFLKTLTDENFINRSIFMTK